MAVVVAPALETQCSLSHCRKEIWRSQPLGDVVLQPEPMQARPGQNDRIKLSLECLVESGLDIAPERHDFEIRTQE